MRRSTAWKGWIGSIWALSLVLVAAAAPGPLPYDEKADAAARTDTLPAKSHRCREPYFQNYLSPLKKCRSARFVHSKPFPMESLANGSPALLKHAGRVSGHLHNRGLSSGGTGARSDTRGYRHDRATSANPERPATRSRWDSRGPRQDGQRWYPP